MYKFYKYLAQSKVWKYAETFNSTLDPNYHAYINWCEENKMSWKLVNASDNSIKFQG